MDHQPRFSERDQLLHIYLPRIGSESFRVDHGAILIFKDGNVVTVPDVRDKSNNTIKGYKTLMEKEPENGKATVDEIITEYIQDFYDEAYEGLLCILCGKGNRKIFSINMIKI